MFRFSSLGLQFLELELEQDTIKKKLMKSQVILTPCTRMKSLNLVHFRLFSETEWQNKLVLLLL